jgi:hypothetical protein
MPWCTAATMLTWRDDGLATPWPAGARVWLNPPFSQLLKQPWMARMAAHGRGTAILIARTETRIFSAYVWGAATAILFLKGRPHFHLPDGTRASGNCGGPACLVAYGERDAAVLRSCGLAGQLVEGWERAA